MNPIHLLLAVVAFACFTTMAGAAAIPEDNGNNYDNGYGYQNQAVRRTPKVAAPIPPAPTYPPLPPVNNASIYFYPTAWVSNAIPPLFGLQTLPQIRIIASIGLGWYEAISAYDPVAIGPAVKGSLRRPASEATTHNKNVALSFATFVILNGMLPNQKATWTNVMTNVLNLDPNNTSRDPATPEGLGNLVGDMVLSYRYSDGYNQLGLLPDPITANPRNYSDHTGYTPVNDAYHLRDLTRWQPLLSQADYQGAMTQQAFIVPQAASARAFGFRNYDMFQILPPVDSLNPESEGYRQQAVDTLRLSAELTDQQKMTAEFFNSKIFALGFPLFYLAQKNNFTLEQFIRYDYITSEALLDAGNLAWNFKRRYDTIRPVSVINNLFHDKLVRAYAGPGKGTQYILGKDWYSYLETQPFSEYPSGSTCLCAAYAGSASSLVGNNFGFSFPFPKGSSRYEPGITPAEDVVLGPFDTFDEYLDVCAESRRWAGVHFQLATITPKTPCYQVGQLAASRAKAMLKGEDMYFDNVPVNYPNNNYNNQNNNYNSEGRHQYRPSSDSSSSEAESVNY